MSKSSYVFEGAPLALGYETMPFVVSACLEDTKQMFGIAVTVAGNVVSDEGVSLVAIIPQDLPGWKSGYNVYVDGSTLVVSVRFMAGRSRVLGGTYRITRLGRDS